MAVPSEVHQLVERFDRDRSSYRSARFNEAQARIDFINPLLGFLGWDVENRRGLPEAYREVVYEDRVKVGGGTKAPDYGFYAGGQRRFFLEAKKPSVNIAGDLAPAVQLRRYAWSAKLPLSILTDFEEFAVYDCRVEPQKEDGPATARMELFTYIRIQALKEFAPVEVEHYKKAYRSAGKGGNYDIYVVFVERGLSLLNKNGRLGYILPHKFFNAKYGASLRELISEGKVPAANVTADEWNFVVGAGAVLFERLHRMPVKLEDVTVRIFQGLKTAADKIYIVEELDRTDSQVKVYSRQKEAAYWLETDLLHPLVKGGDSRRYHLSRTNRLILFPYSSQGENAATLISPSTMKSSYPLTWDYLLDNKAYLESREHGSMRGESWYGYGRIQALDVMPVPKNIHTRHRGTGILLARQDGSGVLYRRRRRWLRRPDQD